jgi:hypothetical protein
MAKEQFNFAAGEIAPVLYGRVDQSRYASGLRTCRNAMVMRHGGVQSRAGTTWIAEVKDSSTAVRLIPFVFNSAQTYVLEFGNLYMRVHKAGAPVREATKTITAITQANPGVVTSVGHGYSNGEEVYIAGIVGMTELNNRTFVVRNATANTFTLEYKSDATDVDTTSFTAYSSGGTAARVYEITTPYTAAQLPSLQYVQSADIVTIVHPSHGPRNLARTGDTSWTLTAITFAPTIAAPANPAVTGAGGTAVFWVVTAVADADGGFEESLASAQVGADSEPDPENPRTVSWDAVPNILEYAVYRSRNGVFGFIGLAAGTSFVDKGHRPRMSDSPPVNINPFDNNEHPAVVAYTKGQRKVYGNLPSFPERVHVSQVGLPNNFTVSLPLKDDDAVEFNVQGRQVNAIRHIIEVNGKLIVLTEGGEWLVEGDQDKILKPDAIHITQQTYHGAAADIPPVNVGGNALYVQARGAIIRDLGFDIAADGYRGNDLTVFSPHLFEDETIKEWAYAQHPHSIVWIVRDDGILLGLTYVREHAIVGWHWHDTPAATGLFESVAVVPESNEDTAYFVVNRTIDGTTRRYIERMETRVVTEAAIRDAIMGMDSVLTFDGRNTGATTMTLTGGTDWDHDESLTLTASASFFAASDVGNIIEYLDTITGDDLPLRLKITGFTSDTVVTVRPARTVPTAVRGTAETSWARAVDSLVGLEHLDGENVAIFADGFVEASPNNGKYTVKTVSLDAAKRGILTLDRPYSVIHVGLPYVVDLEPLDIDLGEEGGPAMDSKKMINRVAMRVDLARGLFFGGEEPDDDSGTDATEGLKELKVRGRVGADEGYDKPVALLSDLAFITIDNRWTSNGRFFMRQVDPLPFSLLAIAPAGVLSVR